MQSRRIVSMVMRRSLCGKGIFGYVILFKPAASESTRWLSHSLE